MVGVSVGLLVVGVPVGVAVGSSVGSAVVVGDPVVGTPVGAHVYLDAMMHDVSFSSSHFLSAFLMLPVQQFCLPPFLL